MAAAMVAVLLAATVGSAYLGAAVVARHRAQAAADLAALAAAARLPAGVPQACALAEEEARAMRVNSLGCEIDGLDAVVTVEAPTPYGNARAAARAGPDLPGKSLYRAATRRG